MDDKRRESLILFIILTILIGLHIYWTLPTYMQHINSSLTTGSIDKLEKFQLTYTYFNSYDNREYSLSREINRREFLALKAKKKLTLIYPKFYPLNVVIQDIEGKKNLLVPVIVHVFFLFGLFKTGKEALNLEQNRKT